MTQKPLDPKSPELHEMLVAYLDGELDAEAAKRVEELLARDPQVEHELHQLDSAWQLLDRLPRAEVDPSFTRSTVEMVALAVERELRPPAASPGRKTALVALLLLSASAAGFFGARGWPDANHELLRDLPIINHLEAYRQTPSIDFLRQLEQESLLAEEPAADEVARPQSASDVASLDSEEKAELNRRYERLVHLPADERRRLRDLHAAVASDGHADGLQASLERYEHWLERLPGIERAELMALDGAARLQRIARLRREEARRLSPEDVPVFSAWVEDRLMKLAADRPALFPPNFQAAPRERRHQMVIATLNRLRAAQPFVFMGIFNDAEARAALYEKLSSRGREQLDRSQATEERRALMQTWFQQAFSPQGMARAAQLSLPDVNDEELKDFFDRQLDPAQRTELLNLPADQMRRQVRWRYEQWKRGK
ncbi:MAG: anti-sigma factor family protein [Pirellulales bacterium]